MTDELPDAFDQLKPQSAPLELRGRVLSAVEQELSRRKKPRWERAFELAVAACLALGIGLNVWQWQADGPARNPIEQHSTQIAERQEFLDAISPITDEATALMLVDRLVSTRLPKGSIHRPVESGPHEPVKN